MLISIIIPTYNRAGFLPEAIASVRGQEPAPNVETEIIIVDDGSTDNTRDILARLGSDLRCIRLEKNRGVSAARNAGILAASGELIAFLDSDDVWMPHKLRTQAALMQQDEDIDLVWGKVVIESLEQDAPHFDSLYNEPFVAVQVGSGLYRRCVFDEDHAGMFDEQMRFGEDFDWLNRARERAIPIKLHNDVVMRYRKHSASLTGLFQNFSASRRVMIEMLKQSLDRRRLQGREKINLPPLTQRTDSVSVVIPVRNGARYLAQAIDSVLAQTRAALEVIVVDDGSTDETPAVAQRYGSSVRYVCQQTAGAAAARNHGVSLAAGDMLAFLDADDMWQPQKLALQLTVLETRPSIDIVFCHAEQFISEDAQRHANPIPERLRILPAQVAGGMLVRRKSFDVVGAFDSTYTRTDIVDWIARANHAGLKLVVLPQVLLRRRWHDNNLGVTARDQVTDYTRVVKAALDRRRASSQAS